MTTDYIEKIEGPKTVSSKHLLDSSCIDTRISDKSFCINIVYWRNIYTHPVLEFCKFLPQLRIRNICSAFDNYLTYKFHEPLRSAFYITFLESAEKVCCRTSLRSAACVIYCFILVKPPATTSGLFLPVRDNQSSFHPTFTPILLVFFGSALS